ncbi:hypothetical protein BH09BAC3_BH09BAC3_28130 [soil metagenome]
MRLFLFSFLFLLAGYVSIAQDSLSVLPTDTTYGDLSYTSHDAIAPPDTSVIQTRSFDQQKLDNLRKDDQFDYKQPPTVVESLWVRFLQWISRIIEWLFRGAVTTNWGRVVVIGLAIVLVAVIVMLLLKVDAFKVFYSGADKGLSHELLNENIHEMNFEKLLQEALSKKEYRLAVRLTFLNALKLLSDKQHVDWRPGKTNHDYVEELKHGELKIGFNELSFYFDYAWYGDFNVNESMYNRVRLIFDNWRTKFE